MGFPRPRRAIVPLVLGAVAAAALAQARPDLDAERLKAGLFRYRTVVDGKDAGGSEIRIRRTDSGGFVFSNRVEGTFSQSWEAVATRAFEPVSAKLTMGSGPEARTIFDLHYSQQLGGRVTGMASSGKGADRVERRVDDPIAADTVDQRIDWAAVMAAKSANPGEELRFHVYDPGTGHSPVEARVLGLETTTVPAGTFETARIRYRIEKNRGAESYEVLVRMAIPRFLVKEQFPNGAVTELVEAKP
jgi:hypothetical protein